MQSSRYRYRFLGSRHCFVEGYHTYWQIICNSLVLFCQSQFTFEFWALKEFRHNKLLTLKDLVFNVFLGADLENCPPVNFTLVQLLKYFVGLLHREYWIQWGCDLKKICKLYANDLISELSKKYIPNITSICHCMTITWKNSVVHFINVTI